MPDDSLQRGDGCCGAWDLSSGRSLVRRFREGEELWDEAVQHLRSREYAVHGGGRDVYSSEGANREARRCVCLQSISVLMQVSFSEMLTWLPFLLSSGWHRRSEGRLGQSIRSDPRWVLHSHHPSTCVWWCFDGFRWPGPCRDCTGNRCCHSDG